MLNLTPRRIQVFVQHFELPPTQAVVESVSMQLHENLKGCVIDLTSEDRPTTYPSLSTDSFFYGAIQKPQDMMFANAGADYALCVAPILLEFRGAPQVMRYNLLTVTARSAAGHEWFWSTFVERMVPVALTKVIKDAIDRVLDMRGAIDYDAPPDEMIMAAKLCTLATVGVSKAIDQLRASRPPMH